MTADDQMSGREALQQEGGKQAHLSHIHVRWEGKKKQREMLLCDAPLPRMMRKTLSRLIHLLVLHLGLHRCHLIIRVSWHAYTEACVFL